MWSGLTQCLWNCNAHNRCFGSLRGSDTPIHGSSTLCGSNAPDHGPGALTHLWHARSCFWNFSLCRRKFNLACVGCSSVLACVFEWDVVLRDPWLGLHLKQDVVVMACVLEWDASAFGLRLDRDVALGLAKVLSERRLSLTCVLDRQCFEWIFWQPPWRCASIY